MKDYINSIKMSCQMQFLHIWKMQENLQFIWTFLFIDFSLTCIKKFTRVSSEFFMPKSNILCKYSFWSSNIWSA